LDPAHGSGRALGRMRRELIGEFLPAALILVLKLNASRPERVTFGSFRHTLLLELFGRGFGFGRKLRAFVRRSAIAAASDYQRPRPIWISEAEVQGRKSTHGKADDMRLIDVEGVEHHANIIAGPLLRIESSIFRNI